MHCRPPSVHLFLPLLSSLVICRKSPNLKSPYRCTSCHTTNLRVKIGMKENQSWPTKEFSEKTKKVHFQRVFATFYCSKSKCAPECQVLGKSVDWFITTCKWDGRQLLHYGYAILEETHSFQRAIATGKDIFLQKYHVHKAINDLTSCLVYQQSANLLKCDVLGVQTFTLKYVWLGVW